MRLSVLPAKLGPSEASPRPSSSVWRGPPVPRRGLLPHRPDPLSLTSWGPRTLISTLLFPRRPYWEPGKLTGWELGSGTMPWRRREARKPTVGASAWARGDGGSVTRRGAGRLALRALSSSLQVPQGGVPQEVRGSATYSDTKVPSRWRHGLSLGKRERRRHDLTRRLPGELHRAHARHLE